MLCLLFFIIIIYINHSVFVVLFGTWLCLIAICLYGIDKGITTFSRLLFLYRNTLHFIHHVYKTHIVVFACSNLRRRSCIPGGLGPGTLSGALPKEPW